LGAGVFNCGKIVHKADGAGAAVAMRSLTTSIDGKR
jgi:hypothetical protein